MRADDHLPPSPFVLLVRHGAAAEEHPAGDECRGLTDRGRRRFRKHARRLVGRATLLGVATSPLVRAVQTAEILAEAAGIESVQVETGLAPFTASAEVIEALATALGPGWAIVGHNPSLAEALARMVGQRPAPPFRKGAGAALVRGGGGGASWSVAWIAEIDDRRREDD